MLNLGAVNNLAPRTAEDLKNPSKDFSLSSTKAQDKAALNSSSTEFKKSLEKKSEINNREKNDDNSKSDNKSDAKLSNTKTTYTNSKKITNSSRDQIEVKEENIDKENIDAETVDVKAKDYSAIVPLYPQNEFFAAQAPIPTNTAPLVETSEETLLKQLDVAKVSPENQPVVKFMKELYQQLGIPPQKLVQAFESLPTEALLQSPKASMETLFTALELQPGEYTKAQILFTEMIGDLNKQAQNLEYKQVQIKPTIADQVKSQNKNMQALVGTPLANSYSPLDGTTAPQALSSLQPQAQPQPIQKPVKSTLEQMIQERLMQSNPISTFQAPQAQFAAPTELGVNSVATQEPVFDAAFLKTLSEANFEMPETTGSSEGSVESAEASQKFKDLLTSLEGNKEKEFSNNSENKDDLSKFFNIKDQMGSDIKMDAQPKMVIDIDPKTNKFNPENIQQILTQAETLAKKGGGEMKIQLRPDGLGEINLKIQVNEGKVGLQMITESQDAKKLIEGSLSELKHALSDHKLNLNDIKVDVSQKSSQDMLQQDSRREDAREFLGQFRQFNEGFRQGFGDTSGMVRQYRSGGKPQSTGLGPVEAKEKRNSNGRLHLVA